MKINEVEEQVGITKRNIRYYEKEGLLSPGRNSEICYRNYTDEDVVVLRQVKLLRKLDVPLEEIRRMQRGDLTLTDGLRRHIIQLARARENLATMEALCQEMVADGARLPDLDAAGYLAEMARMEQEGTRFVNVKKRDTRVRYLGPVAAAAAFVLLMAGIIALVVWGFSTSPEDAPPLGVVVALAAIPGVFIVGVLLALWQRIKQIQGGEEDAASQY